MSYSYVSIMDTEGKETLYDMYTLEPVGQPFVEVRYTEQMVSAAKQVVEIVGADRKILGIKIIRSFTCLSLRDAKVLWELAEKLSRIPF